MCASRGWFSEARSSYVAAAAVATVFLTFPSPLTWTFSVFSGCAAGLGGKVKIVGYLLVGPFDGPYGSFFWGLRRCMLLSGLLRIYRVLRR